MEWEFETLLDEISVEEFILQVRCNVPKHKMDEDTIQQELDDLFEMRMDDFKHVWEKQKAQILKACKK